MIIYSEKDKKMKIDIKIFLHKVLGLSPHKKIDTTSTSGSDRKISITTIHKLRLKCGCKDESIVNRNSWPILSKFASYVGPGHK